MWAFVARIWGRSALPPGAVPRIGVPGGPVSRRAGTFERNCGVASGPSGDGPSGFGVALHHYPERPPGEAKAAAGYVPGLRSPLDFMP
jgi:hypothetical protein